jgi:nucleotide-binding universal stress UspA family protein
MIKKILLAVSGLGHAEEMLKTLKEIPSIQQADVTVLHVVPAQASAQVMTSKWEEGGKILGSAIDTVNLDANKVTAILRQGDPKDVVCQVADEVNADLIIMGSRGLKRLQSILANSVSQYVFQLSSRPMLLVKDDIYIKKIKRIMVAIDGSAATQQCLQLALFLVRDIKGGQLILTHVDKNASSKSGEVATPAEKNPVLAPAIAEAKKQGVQPLIIATAGKPGEEICRLVEERDVDLLIIGSPDRRPSIAKSFVDIDRLISSSLSDYVRVNATCPVLLARTVG